MNARSLLFGFNCYIASMAALYVAFCFELPNPSWAVITVFLTSQPAIEGGVWAKAAYRLGGTVIGLCAALAIIPNLVDAPELMILALAGWLSLCIFVSLQDRTPRSYLAVLAGYGSILVALPLIDNPINIFDTAVARTEEILIGVVCASLAHGLVFPRSVQDVLVAKVNACLTDARVWTLATIDNTVNAAGAAARLKFAGATVDVALTASTLAFEPPRGRNRVAVAKATAARLAVLLPLLTAMEERLRAMDDALIADPDIRELMDTFRAWVAAPVASLDGLHAIVAQAHAAAPAASAASDHQALLEISLLQRMVEFGRAWYDCNAMADALAHPERALPPGLSDMVHAQAPLSLHVDKGIAAWSALTAAVAVTGFGALALWVQWPPATIGIGIAAVLTSLFATLDDPTPILRKFFVWTLIAIPVSAVYVFAILPAVDGFVLLALVLMPAILPTAAFMLIPKHALRALSFALVTTTVIGVQPSYHGDLESFANLALSAVFGIVVALFVTQVMRVFEKSMVARRILRAGWLDLADLARHHPGTTQPFAMRMLDRVGLLLPRLAPSSQAPLDSLRDLRLGVSLDELVVAGAHFDEHDRTRLALLREALARHFIRLASHPDSPLAADIETAIDDLRPAVLSLAPYRLRVQAVTAWVGLRQNLRPVSHEP